MISIKNQNNGNDEPPFKKQKLDTVLIVPDYVIEIIINYALEPIQSTLNKFMDIKTLKKFIDIRNLKFSLISKQFFKVTLNIISPRFYYYHNNETIKQFIKYNQKESANQLTFYREPPLYLEYKILKLIPNIKYFISKVETFKFDFNDFFDQNHFKDNIKIIPYFPSLKNLFLINLNITNLDLLRILIGPPPVTRVTPVTLPPNNPIENVYFIFKNKNLSLNFINFFEVLFENLKQLKLLVLENVLEKNSSDILEYLKKKELPNKFKIKINNIQYNIFPE